MSFWPRLCLFTSVHVRFSVSGTSSKSAAPDGGTWRESLAQRPEVWGQIMLFLIRNKEKFPGQQNGRFQAWNDFTHRIIQQISLRSLQQMATNTISLRAPDVSWTRFLDVFIKPVWKWCIEDTWWNVFFPVTKPPDVHCLEPQNITFYHCWPCFVVLSSSSSF